jgi:predicted MFS family arabinose efflux permease
MVRQETRADVCGADARASGGRFIFCSLAGGGEAGPGMRRRRSKSGRSVTWASAGSNVIASAANGSGRNEEPVPAFFGWKVAWAAFTVAVFSWGVGFYAPPVFLQTLHADHGWPISTISAAITTHFLFSAVLITCLPEVHQRFGVAGVTQAGVALSALGVLAWANVQQPWQLFPTALLSGAGWAATSGAAINAMVAPWFEKDRPKALSHAFNGASIGGLVFTPLWVALIALLGFPVAAAIIGVAMMAVLWPVTAKFLRPRPDNLESASAERKAARPTTSRADLLRDQRFVTMSGAFALGLFAQIGLFAHLVTRLASEFGSNGAAWAVSLTTVCAVAGRTLLGWVLGDRDRRMAASVNFALQACGTALLTLGSGAPAILCGCILFGLGVGNLTSLPPLIAQKEFAASDVGRVVALITVINQAVFAFAPVILGALRDLEGGYTLPFGVAACIQVAASLLVLASRVR